MAVRKGKKNTQVEVSTQIEETLRAADGSLFPTTMPQPVIYNPTDDELSALTYFRDRSMKMSNARQGAIKRMSTNEELFKGHLDVSDKADWQSKLFIPRTYGLVMAELSQLALNRPDILVEPEGREDAMHAPYMKAVLMENWKKNDGPAEFLFGFLDAVKLGISFMEIGYKSWHRKVKEITDFDETTGKIKWVEKNIVEWDDVFFETFRPQDAYFDENAANSGDAMDCARRYTMRYEQFIDEFAEKYPKARCVKPGQATQDPNADETIRWQPFTIENDIDSNSVEVFKYPNKHNDTMWYVAGGVLLNESDDPIPFHHKELPITEIKPCPWDKYTFYGAGLPELIEDLQNEQNTQRNMMHDQAHLNTFTPFLFSSDEDISEDIMRIEPGVGIPVSDPSKFNFIRQGAIGNDAYQMVQMIDDDIRQTTGIDARFQGVSQGGTATESAILKETTLQKINLHLQFIERANMPRFAELWGDTIMQFYFKSNKAQKKIGGKEGEKIYRTVKVDKGDVQGLKGVIEGNGFYFLEVTPEKIRGHYNWNLLVGTSVGISKELTKQLTLRFYSLLSPNPLINKERILRDLLMVHDKNPDDYIITSYEIDKKASVWLAEEQNDMIVAGQNPQIITSLLTPDHIEVHRALIDSPSMKKRQDKRHQLINHVLEEIKQEKIAKINDAIQKAQAAKAFSASMNGSLPGSPTGPTMEPSVSGNGPTIDRIGGLTKRLVGTPGLPNVTKNPSSAVEAGTLSAEML